MRLDTSVQGCSFGYERAMRNCARESFPKNLAELATTDASADF